jgi:hypothetical protein
MRRYVFQEASMHKILVLLLSIAITGCVNVNETIKLFDDEKLSSNDVVTLLPPFKSKLAMELYIDGEKVCNSSSKVCPFIQPIQILPGSHRFSSNNMHRDSNLAYESHIPFEETQVFLIKIVSVSGTTTSYVFETLNSLEKGKSYTLQVGSKEDSEGILRFYAWWLELTKT